MKRQINFRASDATVSEIAALADAMGETQAGIISRAVAALYREVHDRKHFEIASVTEGGSCTWCGYKYEEPEGLTAEEAIFYLARKDRGYGAVEVLSEAVREASKYGDPDAGLPDWIASLHFDGSETVESLAQEWDEGN